MTWLLSIFIIFEHNEKEFPIIFNLTSLHPLPASIKSFKEGKILETKFNKTIPLFGVKDLQPCVYHQFSRLHKSPAEPFLFLLFLVVDCVNFCCEKFSSFILKTVFFPVEFFLCNFWPLFSGAKFDVAKNKQLQRFFSFWKGFDRRFLLEFYWFNSCSISFWKAKIFLKLFDCFCHCINRRTYQWRGDTCWSKLGNHKANEFVLMECTCSEISLEFETKSQELL